MADANLSPGDTSGSCKYSNLRQVLNAAAPSSSVKPTGISEIVVIKCRCGDEVRRIPILNRELTYNELCIMRLSANSDNLQLQYIDDEGDHVLLTDDLDISHAITLSPVLHVIVHDKQTLPQNGKSNVPAANAAELSQMLARIQSDLSKAMALVQSVHTDNADKGDVDQDEQESRAAATVPQIKQLNTADLAEFLDAPVIAKRNNSISAASNPVTPPLINNAAQPSGSSPQPGDQKYTAHVHQQQSAPPLSPTNMAASYNPYTSQQQYIHQQQHYYSHQQAPPGTLLNFNPVSAVHQHPQYDSRHKQTVPKSPQIVPGGVSQLSMPPGYNSVQQRRQ